jgi:hypothetical protein
MAKAKAAQRHSGGRKKKPAARRAAKSQRTPKSETTPKGSAPEALSPLEAAGIIGVGATVLEKADKILDNIKRFGSWAGGMIKPKKRKKPKPATKKKKKRPAAKRP